MGIKQTNARRGPDVIRPTVVPTANHVVRAMCAAVYMVAAPVLALPPQPGNPPASLAVASSQVATRAGAWWTFQQRAYPLGDVSDGAHLRALQQIKRLAMRRSATVAPADGDRWVGIGPAPIVDFTKQPFSGRVAAVAVDPSDLTHWLIGAAQGGVWETHDTGATWVPKTDDQASLAFGAVAFAASDPHVIYAGTGEANFRAVSYAGQGLLKSTDGGTSWVLLADATFAKTAFSDLGVDPHDPDIVIAATARAAAGRDAGWEILPQSIAAPPRGVFKSTNGGQTWVQNLNGEATDLEVNPDNFTQQYAGLGEIYGSALNGVYRSTDAGDSWQRVDGPWVALAGGVGRIEMAIAPSNPSVLYVSIQDALDGAGPADGGLLGLFRTDNAWDPIPSWVQVSVSQIDDGSGVHGYCGWDPLAHSVDDRCWYNHEVVVDPSNPDVLYGAGNGLWRFDGTTWKEVGKVGVISRRSIHSDQHSMVWAGNRLITGNDGGVWSTTNGGDIWTNHNATLAITQFYKGALHPTNPNFALGGNQDNGYVKWLGADAWPSVYFNDGIDVAIAASHPDTHWALASQFLDIVRTTDSAGAPLSFAEADTGIDKTNVPFIARMEKCPANDDVFIAGTDNLWKSTNFFSAESATWSANGPEMGDCVIGRSIDGCITALGFAPSDATCATYAFGTGDGRLLITSNGGSTWTDLDAADAVPNRFVTDLAFDPHAANILYVTLSGFDEGTPGQPGHVFRTMSALAAAPAWRNISPPANLPHNAVALDPVDANLVYVGADVGMWKSTDGAGTWLHMGPEAGMPNVAVYDLEIQPSTRRPFAFTHGRGAFVIACGSDSDCDDANPGNGAETCDVTTGRCRVPAVETTATPTVTPTATPSAAPTTTASTTPSVTASVTATATATRTASPSPSATATLTVTPSVTPTTTSTTTPTRTATSTVTPRPPARQNEGGCSITPPPAGGGGLWIWVMLVLLELRRFKRRAARAQLGRTGSV